MRGLRHLLGALPFLFWAAPAFCCRVDVRAEVAVEYAAGSILVPAVVDGKPATFVLDSGAARTLVSEGAVRILGLARDEWVATTMRGIGGDVRRRNAVPRSLAIGGLPLRRRTAAADLSLPVAELPAEVGGHVIAGLLGADLLASYDLDLDVPHRTLRLMQVRDCPGDSLDAAVPWPHVAVPAVQPVRDVLVTPVTLDGTVLRAELDTGAQQTTILAPGIDRLALPPGPAGPILRGVGPAQTPTRLHTFARMQVGPVVETSRVIPLAPRYALRVVDMLLGADWLAQRRVWISYAVSRLYVAP